MIKDTGQLRAVIPKTHVDGFTVGMLKFNRAIVADDIYADLVIDYYYEITVVNDGTNQRFPKEDYLQVYLSQRITDCNAQDFVADYPLIMLAHYEQLESIDVVYATHDGHEGIWLMIGVHNAKTDRDYAYSCIFQT